MVPVLGHSNVGIAGGQHEGDAARTEPHLGAEEVYYDLVAGPRGRPEGAERGKLPAEKGAFQQSYARGRPPAIEHACPAQG